MNSIRTKATFLTVIALAVTLTVTSVMGVFAIRNIGNTSSRQLLSLLCESGSKNLNSYFEGVEHSLSVVDAYIEEDLREMPNLNDGLLTRHLQRVREIFSRVCYQTKGVLTYYYRVDPAASSTQKGFWFVNLDGSGFEEHEPTDITQYDTEDTSALVWFTVPKKTGRSVWLPPYVTENLDVRVISYNVPVYKDDTFIGVAGIEIDYSDMAEMVDSITLYDNGYAFINDEQGSIIYHPKMDVTTMEEQPKVPEGLISENEILRYRYEGVEKLAVCLPLSNGMRLNVSVPVAEINEEWVQWIRNILLAAAALLVVFVLITLRYAGRITEPLQELTHMAERVNEGDYDCRMDYQGNDEVGILASAFNNLTSHLKSYIHDLNDLAYADALTGVRNKGAFDIYLQNLENELLEKEDRDLEFAICIFDCNDLKRVNDRHGHGKGDIYLQKSCTLICNVFDHSPVFRMGGDEFAVILQNQDYQNRDALISCFDASCGKSRAADQPDWEKLDVARGMAVYDRNSDDSVSDVVRRADRLMYENKWENKKKA